MDPASIFNNFQEHYPFLAQHKYTLLFVAGALEGFTAMILGGFLLSIGKLSIWPAYLVLSCAEVVNGYIWYAIGYWGGWRPINWITSHSETQRKLVEKVKKYLERYTPHAILLAKMTFSVTMITQILTGAIRYPFRKFTVYNIIGSFGWVAIVLAIGYFFGEGYKVIFRYWDNARHLISYVIVALVLVFGVRLLFRLLLFRTVSWVEHFQKVSKKIGEGIDKLVSGDDQDQDGAV